MNHMTIFNVTQAIKASRTSDHGNTSYANGSKPTNSSFNGRFISQTWQNASRTLHGKKNSNTTHPIHSKHFQPVKKQNYVTRQKQLSQHPSKEARLSQAITTNANHSQANSTKPAKHDRHHPSKEPRSSQAITTNANHSQANSTKPAKHDRHHPSNKTQSFQSITTNTNHSHANSIKSAKYDSQSWVSDKQRSSGGQAHKNPGGKKIMTRRQRARAENEQAPTQQQKSSTANYAQVDKQARNVSRDIPSPGNNHVREAQRDFLKSQPHHRNDLVAKENKAEVQQGKSSTVNAGNAQYLLRDKRQIGDIAQRDFLKPQPHHRNDLVAKENKAEVQQGKNSTVTVNAENAQYLLRNKRQVGGICRSIVPYRDNNKFMWLAYAGSAAAFQPYGEGDGERYLRNGRIQENFSSQTHTMKGECRGEQEEDGDLCYDKCKPGYSQSGSTCIASCKPGYSRDGLLCRKVTTSYQGNYGRDDDAETANCTSGYRKYNKLCYKECKTGYSPSGEHCVEDCPRTHKDYPSICLKRVNGTLSKITKSTYSQVGKEPGVCPPGYDKNDILCYKKCSPGFDGIGSRCVRSCGSEGATDIGKYCEFVDTYTLSQYPRESSSKVRGHKYESKYDKDACSIGGWTGHHFYDEQAYIVLRNENEAISMFAFRGTRLLNIGDWLDNINAGTTSVTMNGDEVDIHSGFWGRFNKIKDDLKEQIRLTPEHHKVILTGHSLGGAMATIAAAYFVEQKRPTDAVITIGSPFVGKEKFTEMYKKNVGCYQTLRIANRDDVITASPYLPPFFMGYEHPCYGRGRSYEVDVLRNHVLYSGYDSTITKIYGTKWWDHGLSCSKSRRVSCPPLRDDDVSMNDKICRGDVCPDGLPKK